MTYSLSLPRHCRICSWHSVRHGNWTVYWRIHVQSVITFSCILLSSRSRNAFLWESWLWDLLSADLYRDCIEQIPSTCLAREPSYTSTTFSSVFNMTYWSKGLRLISRSIHCFRHEYCLYSGRGALVSTPLITSNYLQLLIQPRTITKIRILVWQQLDVWQFSKANLLVSIHQ